MIYKHRYNDIDTRSARVRLCVCAINAFTKWPNTATHTCKQWGEGPLCKVQWLQSAMLHLQHQCCSRCCCCCCCCCAFHIWCSSRLTLWRIFGVTQSAAHTASKPKSTGAAEIAAATATLHLQQQPNPKGGSNLKHLKVFQKDKSRIWISFTWLLIGC